MQRRCAAPKIIIWSTHSRRIDPISRSAMPFCQGEAGAALEAIQGALTHSKQETTLRYIRALSTKIAAVAEARAAKRAAEQGAAVKLNGDAK